mgnify:CR=1 FL=1
MAQGKITEDDVQGVMGLVRPGGGGAVGQGRLRALRLHAAWWGRGGWRSWRHCKTHGAFVTAW